MLRGETILALWNGVDPARRAEYDLWHTREHVPQRLTVPGMIGARRYVAMNGDLPEYLTLYEARDAAVFSSEPYTALLNEPTDWSRSMRPSFRDFLRICCENRLSCGGGVGGYAVVLLVAQAETVNLTKLSELFGELLEGEVFTALHFLRRDASIPDVPFSIRQADAKIPRSGIIIAEGYDCDDLRKAIERVLPRLRDAAGDIRVETQSLYSLAYAIDRDWLDHTVTIDHTSGALAFVAAE